MRNTLGFLKLRGVFLQLPLALLDHRFCMALLGNVGDRSHKLEVARGTPRRMSGYSDVPDGAIRQLQPMLKIEALAMTQCSVDLLFCRTMVVAMNAREDKIQCRLRLRITLKDAEALLGPEDLTARNLPAEASRMT
jgi:hypothetical protein